MRVEAASWQSSNCASGAWRRRYGTPQQRRSQQQRGESAKQKREAALSNLALLRALNELALAEVRSPPRSISISCSI